MSKSQMKRINLQKGLPMDTPNHSEVARNIVDKFGIGYINGEKANCLELNITNALVQSFLDGRKSGIEECIKSVHSDTQPWASSRLKNLMREEK